VGTVNYRAPRMSCRLMRDCSRNGGQPPPRGLRSAERSRGCPRLRPCPSGRVVRARCSRSRSLGYCWVCGWSSGARTQYTAREQTKQLPCRCCQNAGQLFEAGSSSAVPRCPDQIPISTDTSHRRGVRMQIDQRVHLRSGGDAKLVCTCVRAAMRGCAARERGRRARTIRPDGRGGAEDNRANAPAIASLGAAVALRSLNNRASGSQILAVRGCSPRPQALLPGGIFHSSSGSFVRGKRPSRRWCARKVSSARTVAADSSGAGVCWRVLFVMRGCHRFADGTSWQETEPALAQPVWRSHVCG
jgi:hypothetical protein